MSLSTADDGINDAVFQIHGFDTLNKVKRITFENLVINGRKILNAEDGNIKVGKFAEGITFKP